MALTFYRQHEMEDRPAQAHHFNGLNNQKDFHNLGGSSGECGYHRYLILTVNYIDLLELGCTTIMGGNGGWRQTSGDYMWLRTGK
jgi:hypothetical protein